jgi:hypothetical protein
MTPEEHYAAGEEWLRKAERWDARVYLLAPWQAAVATAHFTAALYRPPVDIGRTLDVLLTKPEWPAATVIPEGGPTAICVCMLGCPAQPQRMTSRDPSHHAAPGGCTRCDCRWYPDPGEQP